MNIIWLSKSRTCHGKCVRHHIKLPTYYRNILIANKESAYVTFELVYHDYPMRNVSVESNFFGTESFGNLRPPAASRLLEYVCITGDRVFKPVGGPGDSGSLSQFPQEIPVAISLTFNRFGRSTTLTTLPFFFRMIYLNTYTQSNGKFLCRDDDGFMAGDGRKQ